MERYKQNLESRKGMAKLGQILKELRKDLGLSLRKAAGVAGISSAHLCKIENGEIFQSLGITILLRIAKTYQIPLISILKETSFIENSDDYLPPFDQYLRTKFHLSPQAIRDIEIAKTVVETKYIRLTPKESNPDDSKRPRRQEKLIA